MEREKIKMSKRDGASLFAGLGIAIFVAFIAWVAAGGGFSPAGAPARPVEMSF